MHYFMHFKKKKMMVRKITELEVTSADYVTFKCGESYL